jgi:hypothetical protein
MPNDVINYETEVKKLIERLQGQPSLSEATETLENLHRFGVWSRGSLRPRGTLAVPAAPRLPVRDLQLVRTFVQKGLGESCQKALLAIAQWGGGESVFEPISLLSEPHLDKDVDADTPSYCVSALRYIGGPLSVRAILDVLEGDNGDASLQEAAIRAVTDLATGGPLSDIDPADPQYVAASAKGLDPRLAGRLHSTLNEIGVSSSIPFHLQFHAAEALELLGGGLQALHLAPGGFGDTLSLHAGPPGSEDRPGTRSLTVPLVRRAGEESQDIILELLPRLNDTPGEYEEIRPCVYLSRLQTVIVILRVGREFFPDRVATVRVRARVLGQDAVGPEDDTVLIVGDSPAVFEFKIPQPYEWADRPQFVLSEEK